MAETLAQTLEQFVEEGRKETLLEGRPMFVDPLGADPGGVNNGGARPSRRGRDATKSFPEASQQEKPRSPWQKESRT